MKKSFTVGQANELVQHSRSYDLHNCYDFGGLSIAPTRRLRLWFTPNAEHGIGLPSLVIEMSGLEFLELSEGFGVRQLQDLAELGYKGPEDRDLDWLVGEDKATEADHLVFRFSPDDYLRVHARSADLCEFEGVTAEVCGKGKDL